ncbi:MAG: hypothetical protein NZM13_05075 [Cyclobacteriaceae bacterium]|nr:hypothetical protein [Cyclobacteriaceae bacterium]
MRKAVISILVLVSLWEARAQQNDGDASGYDTREEVYAAINQYRVARGLSELKPLRRLEVSSAWYAFYCNVFMADNKIRHAPWSQRHRYVAKECIAVGATDPALCWIKSSLHRLDLLARAYVYVGVSRSGNVYVLRLMSDKKKRS